MQKRALLEQDLEKLTEAREAFLAYLDASIPKDEQGIAFDFSRHPTLDAQKVYEYFYKLDYQARKLRGFLINECTLNS